MLRIAALVSTALLLSACFADKEPTYTICTFISPVGQKIDLNVEVRSDEAGRAEGLMYRKDMADDEGMLFIWPDIQQRHMWMKNTFISLDMVFLHDNRIVGIVENTVPFSENILTVKEPANRVLEVKANSLIRNGIGSQWQLHCQAAN